MNPFNEPFPQDKWLDETVRLRELLAAIEKLAIEQEQKHGMTFENSKIAELAKKRHE